MKKLGWSLLVGLALLPATKAAELTWLTDLAKAEETAKSEGKLVLIDFTGSDWCAYCKQLNKEVFSTKKFEDYAKKNLVLVEADFPNSKPQPASLQKANKELSKKYNISGFPTLVILDGSGKVLGKEEGYGGGGPDALISTIDKYRNKS